MLPRLSLLKLAPLTLLVAGCAMTVVDGPPPMESPADLVVVNARVATMDPVRSEASSFAVSGGRFRIIGGPERVQPFIGTKTRVVDAGGAVVLPGFIDAHLHLFGEGYRLLGLDLVGTKTKREVVDRVGEAARASNFTGWLRGRGWDQNDWLDDSGFPTAAELDAVVTDRPVVLSRIDGHAIWVNSRALAVAEIDSKTPDPPGGRIIRDSVGNPTGVLVDAAADLVWKKVPNYSRDEKMEAARRGAAACVAAGLTGVHEPGVGEEELEILKELYRRRELPLRIYAMLNPGPGLDRYLESGPEVGLFGHRLTVRAVKLYADGALGSRGAALLKPYADEPGNTGLMTTDPAELEQAVKRLILAGFQPAVHAIGDAANRVVLDIFEAATKEHRGLRPRIEHAQLIAGKDVQRFARLGVIGSMQPTHATSDMPWAEARLGRERLAGAYAWRSLLDTGAHLAFGSDAPVESVRPLWGLHAAVTRTDHAGQPPGGWQPLQRLSIDDALTAFTGGAAYAAFEEELKGSIVPGKLADFVVLSADPRHVAPADLLGIEVLETWVAGERVYAREKR